MHNREFSVMGGPLEIIGKLPKRRRLELALENRLFEKRPDLAILVDNGEINLRLASLLHFFKVPVVYFIPPKVWVWRHSRIEKIAAHVSRVLSILPFEEPIYREWEIPFRYVGNPLIDEVPLTLTEGEAKKILGVPADEPALAVFPGSRHSEIKYHAGLFSKSIREFEKLLPAGAKKPRILIPVAPSLDEGEVKKAFAEYLPADSVSVFKSTSSSHAVGHLCLKASRAAIVKSGTSTLEAAVLGTPMVLSYDSSRSTKFLFKHLARYRGFIGMVNLFLVEPAADALGWGEKPATPVVPELILEKCRPEIIGSELFKIYNDGPDREHMLKELQRAKELLYPPKELGPSPVKAVAKAITELIEERGV